MLTKHDYNCGLLKYKRRCKRTIHVRTTSCLICVSHPGTSTAYVLRRYKANNWERRNAPLHYRIWSCEANVSVDRCDISEHTIIATCAIFISRISKFELISLFSKFYFRVSFKIRSHIFKGSRYCHQYFWNFSLISKFYSHSFFPLLLIILILMNFKGIANYLVYCSYSSLPQKNIQ